MELLAAIGGGAFVLASLVIGIRVMWLAQRTRGLPEFAMALGLLLMGGLGYPILILAQFGSFLPDGARVSLIFVHLVFHAVAMPAVAVFNWRVFRPHDAWAKALLAAVCLAVLECFVGQSIDPGYRAMALDGEQVWLLYGQIGVVVFLWSAIESLRYFARLRKREKFGLADPVVANRFLLWGVGTLCAGSVTTLVQVLQALGVDTNGTPAGAAVISPLGLIAACTLWLAFLPPARYTRWVTARAAQLG
jgi:hypothetical protein